LSSGAPAPAESTGDASTSHRRLYSLRANARYGADALRQKSDAFVCGFTISRSARPQDQTFDASKQPITRAVASMTKRPHPDDDASLGTNGKESFAFAFVLVASRRAGWSLSSRDASAGQTARSSAVADACKASVIERLPVEFASASEKRDAHFLTAVA
jgi:hypothetical protein